jgi:hypothetical protein
MGTGCSGRASNGSTGVFERLMVAGDARRGLVMLARIVLVVAAVALVPFACTGGAPMGAPGSSAGGAGGQGSDDALIVPAGLDVKLEDGGAGVLTLFALTLQQEPDGLALYAALRNDGDVPACDAALKVTLYDRSNQPLGNWINGLYTSHFYLYTLPDGSTTVAACASPGDVTMTRIATMAPDLAVGDVGQVVYYYSYFALDAVPVDGLTVGALAGTTGSAGISYSGSILNQLDRTASEAAVTVFPLNRVGRPLGMTSAGDPNPLPAGASWSFQTPAIDVPAVDDAAFPSASFSN